MGSLPIDIDFARAVRLLNEQGYFTQFDVRLSVISDDQRIAVMRMLRDLGYGGDVIGHETGYQGDQTAVSFYDPGRFEMATIDALVRDEAQSKG